MANVLGLSFFFHDSAAALVCDGQIVAAAAEERFSRRKHDSRFPKHAIEYCLEAGELGSINELDAVVFYEKPLLKFQRIIETLVEVWPRGCATFATRLPVYLSSRLNVPHTIEQMLPAYQGPILFSQHHLSHAASAFYPSPFDEAAILTIDGVGEWETATIGWGRDRHIELTHSLRFPHSVGLLYSALTSYLGFRVNDGEWKVMGLSPYGKPCFAEQLGRLVELLPDGSFRLNMKFFAFHYSSTTTAHLRHWERLFGFPPRRPRDPIESQHMDLARSGQELIERIVLHLARAARERSGMRRLVMSGGVALNGVANWKIEQEGIFDEVWIQPAAGDDGGALGAALLVAQQRFDDPPCLPMEHALWGPRFEPHDVEHWLIRRHIPYEHYPLDQLVERVADRLARGEVVGWFQGRMEFGPRALGARSILADPTRAEMKDVLNDKIKFREFFRPFAPAVLRQHAHEYFEVAPGTDLPFMLKVTPVRSDCRHRIPAVTHCDGSARVQTVDPAVQPAFAQLLRALAQLTGVPIVLNTSFNVRGEPIVCSPEDAYNCFLRTGLDALVIEDCLLSEKPAESAITNGHSFSDRLEAGLTEAAETGLVVQPAVGPSGDRTAGLEATTERVLAFYEELPFNYYSNAVDTAVELNRSNRLRAYPTLNRFLRRQHGATLLDVGCGAGWFVHTAAHFYQTRAIGVDLNATVLRQAKAVGRFLGTSGLVSFCQADLFAFDPSDRFDIVNSLGVLHHTADCRAAVSQVSRWVKPGGYLHLGLYHRYGREPFLKYFERLQAAGLSEQQLCDAFGKLNPEMTDATHLRSWFRDQVLHPHETQHTYEELSTWLEEMGFTVEATSINRFRRLPTHAKLLEMERRQRRQAEVALYRQGRYFPGFFVVWARRL